MPYKPFHGGLWLVLSDVPTGDVMRLSREKAKKLAAEFKELLDEKLNEQEYQSYMEKNPYFIPREFIQNHGLHFNLVFRKLSLAKDYTTDFFYLSKSSADWNCVLVEIEKPSSRYFKSKSNKFSAEFQGALSQINQWRAWFENGANKEGFINGTIKPARVPMALQANPCHIKYVLVHGRRAEFEGNEIRSGLIRGLEREDFKILSFDSLLEDILSKSDAYIVRRLNENIEIISKRFVDESVFSWVDPSYLIINEKLKSSILKSRSKWFSHRSEGGLVLDHVLPMLMVVDV